MLEFLKKSLMDSITEICDSRPLSIDNDWSIIVWNLSLWLGVNSNQIEIVPNLLHELVKIPFILG